MKTHKRCGGGEEISKDLSFLFSFLSSLISPQNISPPFLMSWQHIHVLTTDFDHRLTYFDHRPHRAVSPQTYYLPQNQKPTLPILSERYSKNESLYLDQLVLCVVHYIFWFGLMREITPWEITLEHLLEHLCSWNTSVLFFFFSSHFSSSLILLPT